jgi:hypothetical protein
VLNVALQELTDRLHNGAYREDVLKEISDEMQRSGGTPVEDEDTTTPPPAT